MRTMLYFVKRRDQSGTIINTVCATTEHVVGKVNELRAEGYAEVWIEDADGRPIDEKALKDASENQE